MGLTKSELFSAHQNRIAAIAKALAHPARIAIIEFLLKSKSCICGDIVNELPLAQPTVSQHLKELKNGGIIKGEIDGTAICYCLDERTLEILQNFFSEIIKETKDQNCCSSKTLK